MALRMKNCWEIFDCGRQKFGNRISELGECIASKESLGHSCWAIAGTLCQGKVQGTVDHKKKNCLTCKVYKLYHRTIGTLGKRIPEELPEEHEKYNVIIMKRIRKS